MVDLLRSSVRIVWTRNGAYLDRLLDDLADAPHAVTGAGRSSERTAGASSTHAPSWFAQPTTGAVINHPAWIVGHLTLYRRVILDLLRGTPFNDPLDAPFGRGSKVSLDPAAHPPPREMRAEIDRLGAEVLAALDTAPRERFEAPNPLARWRELHPRVGEQLVTLMVKHESFHLGQLSAWRRAMGLPSVAM